MTHDYPLALALEDFVPVLLGLTGFYLLGGLRRPLVGRAGAVLIGLGGLAKCLWKVLVAASDVDIPWLQGLLFPLMALGAILLIGSLHPRLGVVVAVAGAALVIVLGVEKGAFITATSAVTLVSVIGIVWAARRRLWTAVVLYLLGIAGVTGLVPLRRHPLHETLGFQWLEQSVNTLAQAAFLAACVLLTRSARKEKA